MNQSLRRLPLVVVALVAGALLLHGPIAQPLHYHAFADQHARLGVPNGADVLSNIGFAIIGAYGWLRLRAVRRDQAFAAGRPGYALFLIALMLTAAGSAWYHLAPDNARLLWDRLPIALACAGLLAGVSSELRRDSHARRSAVLWAIAGVASVAWWYVTEMQGRGDLRPYLLLQGLPLLLIPLWQAIYRAPPADRLTFAAAILCYALAKVAEVHDHEVLAASGWISGHTLKHLLAQASAAIIVARLVGRVRKSGAPPARRAFAA